MEVRDHELIIVGAGPAGLCAALYAARSEMDAVMIDPGPPGGQLLLTDRVDDYPGIKTIGGMELADAMAEHAESFGTGHTRGSVSSIERDSEGRFVVQTAEGDTYRAPAVIMTAGGTHKLLDVPGESEYSGRGVSYCAICDGAFFKGERIAVIGGGDAAVEEGEFLTRYAEKLYVIHRRDEFRAQKMLQDHLLENPKVEVIWDTVVDEIVGQPTGASGLKLRNVKTGAESELDVTGVFIFIGFTPNTASIKEHVDHDESGYIVTDCDMRTSVPGLFAAGDLRSQLVRQITTAVGDATTAVFAAVRYLKERSASHGGSENGSESRTENMIESNA